MATTYQDIDISFASHPSTKDVLKLYDVSAAKFALKNLLLTSAGENFNDMYFGVGIRSLQFEILTPVTSAFFTRKIQNQVKQYLPEIVLQDTYVGDNPDTGEISITIQYYVRGNLKLQNYSLVLERSR
jgi:phage baseplate assembly protein W